MLLPIGEELRFGLEVAFKHPRVRESLHVLQHLGGRAV